MSEPLFSALEKSHTLFTLVGPSGAGKTTIITAAVKQIPGLHVIKTTTSRQRRGMDDDQHYQFATKALIEAMYEQGKILQVESYAGNLYCTPKNYVHDMLLNGDCINALTEHGVEQFRSAKIPLKVIGIVPLGAKQQRADRQAADSARSQTIVDFDLVIHNDFSRPDGLHRSIDQLVSFILAHRSQIGRQSHPLLTMPPPPRTNTK